MGRRPGELDDFIRLLYLKASPLPPAPFLDIGVGVFCLRGSLEVRIFVRLVAGWLDRSGWLTGRLARCPCGWLAGGLAGWPAGWLAGLLVGRLAGWPASRPAGRLVGRMAGNLQNAYRLRFFNKLCVLFKF